MTAIDRWVIHNALEWLASRGNEVDALGHFSINLSGHSLNDEGFADYVLEELTRSPVPTSKICFEITETAAIANLDQAVEFMNRMKIIGCHFALDDFGTGLSSYSYLRNLPVDYLKIDGVFVKDLDRSPGDFAVVKSINEIGHVMGKLTIAEFVENDDILERLREIGVDYGQGYGIERPRPLSEFKA
jgi:EAL domain-containing protein (putative c-di-GMP-specific phosphodiesterase class I)